MLTVKLPRPGVVELQEAPVPEPGEGQALIKVHAASICGSDMNSFRGTNNLVSYPRVIGHEVAGEVVSIPQNAAGIAPGDAVLLNPYLYCGQCYPCSVGRTNCCTSLQVIGVHIDGGMAEYVTHPADMLLKLPEGMDWALAPLAEPLSIALHGLHRAGLQKGEHIAISGAGPIGLFAAMAALHYGATPIMIDPVAERLEMARSLGVQHTLAPGGDLSDNIRAITGPSMAEVAMEASGANAAILASLDIVAYAGRVIFTGWPKADIPFPTSLITLKELDVRGARTSRAAELEEAIDLIYNGKVNARAILTATVPAAELPAMVRRIDEDPGSYLKVTGLF